MYEYSVVCKYTGEILYRSPFLYLCDKAIRNSNLVGPAVIYDRTVVTPTVPEYNNMYFELQMIAIHIKGGEVNG
jgi:hypothetical protein